MSESIPQEHPFTSEIETAINRRMIFNPEMINKRTKMISYHLVFIVSIIGHPKFNTNNWLFASFIIYPQAM